MSVQETKIDRHETMIEPGIKDVRYFVEDNACSLVVRFEVSGGVARLIEVKPRDTFRPYIQHGAISRAMSLCESRPDVEKVEPVTFSPD